MNKSIDIVKTIRNDQLTNGILFLAILGLFALLTSQLRAVFIGYNNIMYLHIGLYLLILISAIFGNYLNFNLKAIIILGTAYLVGLVAIIAWGLIGLGLVSLFAFCILATILYGLGVGIFSLVLSIISIGLVGSGVFYEIISYEFNISNFLTSPSTWLANGFGILISAGIIVVTLSTMNNRVYRLIKNLDEKNTSLSETNIKLENALNEKRELKAGLERAQKMELIGTLAGSVAHDLNNVLSASISYPELILMDLSESSPLKEPMEVILKSSKKAAAIVDDLLTLVRRGVQIEEVSNLNDVVRDCLSSPEFEKIMLYHRGVELDVYLMPDLENIIGSSFHLNKTLTNLISNAAEAILNGGKIKIETYNAELINDIDGFEKINAGNYAVLKVSDTGKGISFKERKNIFEPFYTKKVMGKSGTGLGMTIVRNTVKDHKGYIDIESIEGKGTTFSLYFPITRTPVNKTKTEITFSEYKGRGELILIIDDVEEQREIASKILRMLGYNVETVSGGREAIDFIKNISPDLIILDMIMAPGLDGLDTYKEIIKVKPQQKTIIVSGYSETDRIKQAQKLGAGAYIRKPYTIEKIGIAIKAELEKKN